MSKRDRDRKKTSKLRKQRTIDQKDWRSAVNELGNRGNQSHSFDKRNEESVFKPRLLQIIPREV